MLTLPDFLQPLERFRPGFPREAVAAALARREESVPVLVAALDWCAAHADEIDDDFILHEFALRLLAHLQAPEGLRPALAFARLPRVEDLLGDTVTETLPSILAALAIDRWRELAALVEDEHAYEFARGAGIDAMATLHRLGAIPESQFTAYLASLFLGRLERRASFVWDEVIAICTDLGRTELLPAIRQAYAEGMADPTFEQLERVEEKLRAGFTAVPPQSHRLYTDAAEDMADWPGFEADFHEQKVSYQPLETMMDPAQPAPAATVSTEGFSRRESKVGRNEPCPCGSGKKYKKCCGQ